MPATCCCLAAGHRHVRRWAGQGGAGRKANSDLTGLYQLLEQQQLLILKLLTEQQEQRRQLESLEAKAGGPGRNNWVAAGGGGGAVVRNTGETSLRARANVNAGSS